MAYRLPYGYGRFVLYDSKTQKIKHVLAHRFSWQISNGPIPKSFNVLHKCDNPSCVNPSHLFLGTYLDNAIDRDAKKRGNWHHGEAHYKAILTAEDARNIREQLRVGVKAIRLAEQYNVNRGTISCIKHNQSWKT